MDSPCGCFSSSFCTPRVASTVAAAALWLSKKFPGPTSGRPAILRRAAPASSRSPVRLECNGLQPAETPRGAREGRRFEQAHTEMESCLLLDPSPQTHFRLGLIYRRLGLDELSQIEMDVRKPLLRKNVRRDGGGLSAQLDSKTEWLSSCTDRHGANKRWRKPNKSAPKATV